MRDRPDLDGWFMGLRGQGPHGALCCNFAEAEMLTDVQWEPTCDGNGSCHYRVFLDNHWMDVPDRAVVPGPNRMGTALVWPQRYPAEGGKVYDIRCFMPGAGT